MPPEIVTSTRPGRIHATAAALLAGLLLAAGACVLPDAHLRLPANPSFMPAFGAATFLADLLTAILLLAQSRLGGDPGLNRLGAAYLFSAMIIVPHLAAFPEVIAAAPLIGTSASAVWLWAFWHGGFALLVIRHVLLDGRDRPASGLWLTIAGIAAAVLALAVIATRGLPLLPTLLSGTSYERLNTLGIGPFVLVSTVLALALALWRFRLRSVMGLWLAVAMLAASVDVALTLSALSRFTLGWYGARCASLLSATVLLGALLTELLRLFGRIGATNARLERLAATDGLTMIANRRALDQALDTEWRRAGRDRRTISLLLADVDLFKKFNDRYGHIAGDECLRAVATAFAGSLCRAGDLAARYGGEEFAVLLPATDAAGARVMAERVRGAVEALTIPHAEGVEDRVTVSIGIASARPRPGQPASDLLKLADTALYRAKAGGRNRVAVPVTSIPAPPAGAGRSSQARWPSSRS